MYTKIGNEMINLSNVRSVSQNDDKRTMNISLMADYEYDVKIMPTEAVELFQKAGIEILKITANDFVVSKNVVSLSPDGKEITVIYKDGHDETYSNTKSLNDIIKAVASLSEVDEDDEEDNIDVPRNTVIPSDLQEEDEPSRSSIGVQVLIGVIAVAVIAYQLYKSGMLK